jgi:hypothetical protein
VNIGYHRTDISGGIRFVVGREFDRVQVFVGWGVKVLRVSFVEGIDLSPGRDLDLGMG